MQVDVFGASRTSSRAAKSKLINKQRNVRFEFDVSEKGFLCGMQLQFRVTNQHSYSTQLDIEIGSSDKVGDVLY